MEAQEFTAEVVTSIKAKIYDFALRSVFDLSGPRDDLDQAYRRGWNDAMASVRRKLDE